jgi:hypothetical protein
LFEYSSEVIETGVTTLDNIYEEQNLDLLVHQFELESGDLFLLEDSASLILETYAEDTSTGRTDGADFQDFNNLEDILDFSEVNPFGELG